MTPPSHAHSINKRPTALFSRIRHKPLHDFNNVVSGTRRISREVRVAETRIDSVDDDEGSGCACLESHFSHGEELEEFGYCVAVAGGKSIVNSCRWKE